MKNKMKRIIALFLTLLIVVGMQNFVPTIVQATDQETSFTILERGSTWSYSAEGTNLDKKDWQTLSSTYDTSGWPKGTAPIGFARTGKPTYNELSTKLEKPADGNYPSIYYKTFIEIPEDIDLNKYKISGKHLIDDGALLYANGNLVYNYKATVTDAVYTYDSWSEGEAIGDAVWEDFTISSDQMSAFKNGTNVITAIVKNDRSTSSDTIMDFEMVLEENNGQVVEEPSHAFTNITLQLGSDESEINFCWYSDTDEASGYLQIAKKSEFNEDGFSNTGREIEATVTFVSEDIKSNNAVVTGLEPSTEYIYRVGDGTNFSSIYSFETKDTSSYNAILVGDPQIGSSGNITGDIEGWTNTVNEAITKYSDTSFILSAGDQVNRSTSEEEYKGFFSAPELTSIPLIPTVGNHDNNVIYSYHYNSPNESDTYGTTSAGGDYWFTYGKTLYMVLNSNNSSATSHDTFMGNAIVANKDKNIKWKVVMFHHALYSSASHSDDQSIINLRNTLAPVMDKYDIDVVLAGHDHCYTRSYQMLAGEAQGNQTYDAEGRVVNPTGTLYITANSASGSKYYDLQNFDSTYADVRWQLKKPTYSNIEVTEDTFTISTYRVDNGEMIDTYTILKDEDFSGGTVTKFDDLIRALDDEIGEDHSNPKYVLKEEEYSEESWSNYLEAIRAGIQVESKLSATQDEVDAARWAIVEAKGALICLNTGDIQPYLITLQPGTDETEMNFSWATSEGSTTSLIQIAKASEMIDRFTFPDNAEMFTAKVVPLASDIFSNQVTVTGLEPATEYAYRLGDGTHHTKVYTLKIKESRSYNAILVGDPQIGASGSLYDDAVAWNHTITKALNTFEDTSFILSAGDQVNTADSEDQYLGFFSANGLETIPLVPTIGNHDNHILYNYVFNSPNESDKYGVTDSGGDYSFTYGNTLYMVLNSNNNSALSHENFIKEAIEKNKDKDIKWTVVMFHHALYSSASHASDGYIVNLRNSLAPIMDQYDIDVVLAGHDHCYTRSYQMLGGEPQKNQTVDSEGRVVNPTGTLYITANSASGSKYYDMKDTPETYAAERQQLRTPTYSNVEVTDHTFTISTYRVDTGDMVDTYTIYKGESAALAQVNLTADEDTLTTDLSKSINLTLTAKDALDNEIDLADESVVYKTEPSDILEITPEGTVSIKNQPERDITVKIWAEVTKDGFTVSSNSVNIHIIVGKIVAKIKNSLDDMEERPDGSLDYDSSDLEICWEKPDSADKRDQLVGIRFVDLMIPKGAVITNAYIQFTVDEPDKSSDVFDVEIKVESSANSAAFENKEHTVSSRKTTEKAVRWTDVPKWTGEHDAAEDQRTPDIASLVQKIVDMDGWEKGNAISFIFDGEGTRSAESYDGGGEDQAPQLHISYNLETDGQKQDAPTGLTGLGATSSSNNDGKIIGTTVDMEYKLSTDEEWIQATGIEITGLTPGTYNVRYAAKEGYYASEVTDVIVPEYTGFVMTIGKESAGGAGYTRVVKVDTTKDLQGKYLVAQFTEGTGINAKVSVIMTSATSSEMSVSYQAAGTKVDVWLVSGMPDLVGENMNVQLYAYSSTN